MANTISKYLVCLAPFWMWIFDLFSTLFSISHSEDSSAFTMSSIVTLIIVAVIYFWNLLKDRKLYNKELIFFVVVIVFFILYMITGKRFWGSTFALFYYMRKAVAYSLICMLSFYVIRREQWMEALFHTTKWFAIIACCIVSVHMIPQLGLEWGAVVYYGTLRYQSMGYLCSNIISVLVVCLMLTNKNSARLGYCVLIVAAIFSLLISGARGAVLALFIATGSVIALSVKVSSIPKILISLLIGVAVIVVVGSTIDINALFPDSFASRTFNYISDGSIDLDNRGDVFTLAIEYIERSPVFGYGIGSAYYYLGIYPHNLFLELMFDGGIIYTVFITILLLYRIYYWIKCFRIHKEIRGTFAVIIVNIANSMLSGSYYVTPWYYLIIFFDASYTPVIRNQIEQSPNLYSDAIAGDELCQISEDINDNN